MPGAWGEVMGGPSGRSKTHAERIASGERRIVVWLVPNDMAMLEHLQDRFGTSAAETVREAIRKRFAVLAPRGRKK